MGITGMRIGKAMLKNKNLTVTADRTNGVKAGGVGKS